jgi:hypothetical protein
MGTFKHPELRASAMRLVCLAQFIPTDGTTGGTTSHLTWLSNNDSQVIGYSHSTKLQKKRQPSGWLC